MGEKGVKGEIAGGLIWSFGERITAQMVSTIVTIVLARVLDPEHYGIISMVLVFINICNVFVIGGMGSAIVQKKDVDERDYNTAFIISITMSLVLYALLFVTAPLIANFYEMNELALVVRVMAMRLPIAAINTIQQAHVQRAMTFRRFFVATLFGTVISGAVGILMALNGFGVWALVAQYLANSIIGTIVLFIVDGWIPKLQFSWRKAKSIFSFGWKVLATELVYTLEGNFRSLVIGKVFGSSNLAYYDQGKKFPSLLVTNLNSAINKVMLPTYSRQQDNLVRLKQMLRRSISVGVYILAPILVGFAIVSDTFIKVILSEKWLASSPYIKIFCIVYLMRPLETSCHQALLAIGRSDKVLQIMVSINLFALLSLIVAVFGFHSVYLIAVGSLLTTLVSIGCFLIYASKLLGYKPREQMHDIAPTLIANIVVGVVVYLTGFINIKPILLLTTQVFTGAILYVGMSYLMKLEVFNYLLCFVRKSKNSKSEGTDSLASP